MEVAVNFIKTHALKGPEDINEDGQYDLMLKQHSKTISDDNDSELCSYYRNSLIESM